MSKRSTIDVAKFPINKKNLFISKSCHGQAICQLFEMKRFFLFIGNLAASIVENVSTQAEEQPLGKTYTRRSELFRTNHFWRVDKVSDEIKPHNKKQEIPQQSLRVLTFFYRKSFLLQFLQSPATWGWAGRSRPCRIGLLYVMYPYVQDFLFDFLKRFQETEPFHFRSSSIIDYSETFWQFIPGD